MIFGVRQLVAAFQTAAFQNATFQSAVLLLSKALTSQRTPKSESY